MVRVVIAALLLVIAVGASAVGAAQWYAQGGPQDFRSAVTFIADRAQPGDGMLIFSTYERIPVEWYMGERPAAERCGASRLPGDSVGCGPVGLRRERVVQAGRH